MVWNLIIIKKPRLTKVWDSSPHVDFIAFKNIIIIII